MAYRLLVPGFVMAGVGMGLVFAPAAYAVLSAVRPEEAGQASGATNTIREIGGVLGVAVLASVFTGTGGYEIAAGVQRRPRGRRPAVGAVVVALGALAALAIPGKSAQPTTAVAGEAPSTTAAPQPA